MFRIGEGRYGISKKERERNSPCLGVERLSEVRHIHNSYEQSVSLNPTVVEELHPSVGEVATCHFNIICLGADLRWDSQSASCNNQVQKLTVAVQVFPSGAFIVRVTVLTSLSEPSKLVGAIRGGQSDEQGLVRNVSQHRQFCSDISYFWYSNFNTEGNGNANSRSAWLSDPCQDLHTKNCGSQMHTVESVWSVGIEALLHCNLDFAICINKATPWVWRTGLPVQTLVRNEW